MKKFILAALLLAASVQAASSAPEGCRLERIAEIPVTSLPDGRFTVPVTVAGRKLNFLLDTGGAYGTISSAQANDLHLPVGNVSGGLRGVAGTKYSSASVLGSITLGGIDWLALYLYVDPDLPPGVDGTLAPDIMKKIDLDIDLSHGKLGLFTQNHCRGKVVYWTTSGYILLPMDMDKDKHIEVPITLDGVKIKAQLDTGAQTSIVSMRALRALGLSEKSPTLKALTDSEARYQMYDHPFKKLEFDGITVNNPNIKVVSDNFLPSRWVDMIIGVSIVRQLHVYIDYDEEKLYITAADAN
jgi:predicted aspartyl protease